MFTQSYAKQLFYRNVDATGTQSENRLIADHETFTAPECYVKKRPAAANLGLTYLIDAVTQIHFLEIDAYDIFLEF